MALPESGPAPAPEKASFLVEWAAGKLSIPEYLKVRWQWGDVVGGGLTNSGHDPKEAGALAAVATVIGQGFNIGEELSPLKNLFAKQVLMTVPLETYLATRGRIITEAMGKGAANPDFKSDWDLIGKIVERVSHREFGYKIDA